MIKIGLVDIHTSHPVAFTDYFHKGDRAQVVAICDDGLLKPRRDDYIQRFDMKNICQNLEEMLPLVDIAFIMGCNWDEHIEKAMPFIEAGKPVFIDKPFVGNLRDCRRIEELAENGASILGSSSVRYCQEVEDLKSNADENGQILSVFTNLGVDEFNYAIHTAEMVQGLLGTGAVSVTHIASQYPLDQYLVKYEDGKLVIIQTQVGVWQPFSMTVVTDKNTFQVKADDSTLYFPMLDRICDFMENGRSMAPASELTESVKILLAGKESKSEKKEIRLEYLSDGFPGYDGTAFSQEYVVSIMKKLEGK